MAGRSDRLLADLARRVSGCRDCPRLVAHREASAADPPKRYRGETYWARPVPPWGAADARLMLVGLAPAAHGGNRTGRIFTGDRSGDFLFQALYETGFANQPTSTRVGDGLELIDAYVAAAVRCAPPDNKPTPDEHRRCLPYLVEELGLLTRVQVVVALGGIAWEAYLRARGAAGLAVPKPAPKFGHAAQVALPGGPVLMGTYHPSQQNTFTGRLTPEMMRAVFQRAREIIER